MLTSDLVSYSKSGRYIKPCFISSSDPELNKIAGELLDICRLAAQKRICRRDFQDMVMPLRELDSKKNPVNALLKLLEERMVSTSALEEVDYPAMRRELFAESSKLLGREDHSGYEAFLSGTHPDPYGDLPEFDRITGFEEINSRGLLDLYNCALVQALLLKAQRVTVITSSTDQLQLRKLLKYLKFFRLLCDIGKNSAGALKLEISGPFSIFGTTRKYALNLASFFPAVLLLDRWELRAEITGRNSVSVLRLDETSQLVSHYRSFSGFVPPEIRLFHRNFAEKCPAWQISGDTPVFNASRGQYIVPDLSFTSAGDGVVIHLELFHRWHSGQLEQRLELLERRQDMPLVIGIDRALCDGEKFEELKEKYPAAAARCFLFRDFPGVDTVARTLDKLRSTLK